MMRTECDGVIVIDKPKQLTSMDVVREVKRLARVKRVGHAGTLDPIATGVLPVCLGQATRFMDYLVDAGKTYYGEITLGAATSTYDAEGEVTAEADYSAVAQADVEALLPRFTGAVLQQPPMYSAVKHQGKRLYELARAGLEVERPDREVDVYNLSLRLWDPPRVAIEVQCGKGFYMRTLAHDIGAALGCHAHLSALTRTKVGPFSLDNAISLDQLKTEENWETLMEPPDAALLNIDALSLPPSAERRLRNGQPVTLPAVSAYAKHLDARRAYAENNRFLGLVRFNRPDNSWQPEKVLARPTLSPYAPQP